MCYSTVSHDTTWSHMTSQDCHSRYHWCNTLSTILSTIMTELPTVPLAFLVLAGHASILGCLNAFILTPLVLQILAMGCTHTEHMYIPIHSMASSLPYTAIGHHNQLTHLFLLSSLPPPPPPPTTHSIVVLLVQL